MARIALGRDSHARSGQLRLIGGGQRSAPSRRTRQSSQPRPEDRRLHFVEARVYAELDVPIALGLAAVAQSSQPIGERGVIGDDRTAVAKSATALGGVEAGRSANAKRADRLTP